MDDVEPSGFDNATLEADVNAAIDRLSSEGAEVAEAGRRERRAVRGGARTGSTEGRTVHNGAVRRVLEDAGIGAGFGPRCWKCCWMRRAAGANRRIETPICRFDSVRIDGQDWVAEGRHGGWRRQDGLCCRHSPCWWGPGTDASISRCGESPRCQLVTTAMESPNADSARQAIDAIRGYEYQVLAATLAWARPRR